jgi:hypothetical protein
MNQSKELDQVGLRVTSAATTDASRSMDGT